MAVSRKIIDMCEPKTIPVQLAFSAAKEYSGRGNCNVSNAQRFFFFPLLVDKLFLFQLSVMTSNCPAIFSHIYVKSVTIRGIFRLFDICNK